MEMRNLENESLLFLYDAGELPEADRAELEAALKTDSPLREQLLQIRQVRGDSLELLRRIDRMSPVPASASALRDVSHAMRQWNVDRLARPVAAPATGRRIAWWAWSLGGVVAAVLMFCVFWGFSNDAPTATPRFATSGRADGSASPIVQNGTTDTADPSPDTDGSNNAGVANAARRHHGAAFISMDSSSQQLAALEQDVRYDLRLND